MRFEKLPLETIFNNKAFNRHRAIKTPLKWNNVNFTVSNQLYATSQMSQAWYRKYFNFVLPVISWFHWTWRKENMHVEGLTWDDYWIFNEGDMRRDEFYQHVMARNFHPYELNLYKYRRFRYFKVDETIPGFEVPEYLQKEARDRLFTDFYEKRSNWHNFLHDNYGSELSAGLSGNVTESMMPLDFVILSGWLDHRNWDRLFYNESLHGEATEKEAEIAFNPKLPYDLNTESGKREFIAQMNHLNKYLPGCFAKHGEEINHQRLIAMAKAKACKELTKDEMTIMEQLQTKVLEDQKLLEEKPINKKIVKKIGSILPKFLQNLTSGKSLMAN